MLIFTLNLDSKPKIEKDSKKKKKETSKKARTSLTDAERECGFEKESLDAQKSKTNDKIVPENQPNFLNESDDTKVKAKKISVTNSKASTQNTNNLSKQQSKSDKPSKSSFSHPTSHHGNSKLGQSGTNVRSNVNANQSLPTFQPKPLTKQDLIQHQHLQRQFVFYNILLLIFDEICFKNCVKFCCMN